MDGVLLVPLIKFYIEALFGPVMDMLYCLSSTNQYFFILCIMVQDIMTKYIIRKLKKSIDDDRSGVFPKQHVKKMYNSKYQLTYSNRYSVIKMTI